MEFPIIPFLTGILYKLFGVHEYLCLVIPFLSGLGLVWITYRLGSCLFDRAVGFAAGMITAVAPTLIMLTTTGPWVDQSMVFFGTLGLYMIVLWVQRDQWRYLALGSLYISTAILIKLTALYLGFPLLYLFIRKYGSAWWKTPVLWVTGIAILIPPVLWYWHAYHLYTEYHNTFGILSAGYSKFGEIALLTSPYFYVKAAYRVFMYHLTPVASITFFYGIWLTIKEKSNVFLHVWLATVLFYALVVAKGVYLGYYQYMLPILPVGAIFAGFGMLALVRRLVSASSLRNHLFLRKVATIVCVLLFALNAMWALHMFWTKNHAGFSIVFNQLKKTGQLLKTMTAPGSLLIVVDDCMDDRVPETSMTPPDVFYFSDRRGWFLSMAWLSKKRIEQLRLEGARYFVVSGQAISVFREKQPQIFNYLSQKYKKVMDSADGIVFDFSGQ
jgi:4-amino-4-deoxy-L-arabinose transferase-like glycosyltransferase